MNAASESKPKIDCRGLEAKENATYLQFAREAFGTHSIQANPSFLAWLYQENPNSLGMTRDLLILADEGKVVGAHHRMRIPWQINGKRFAIPSLHDLYVLPAYRSASPGQGFMPPGLKIMLAALEDEPHISVFGLTEAGDKIYERLRVPTLQLFYLYKVRSKIRAGTQMAASRLGWTLRRKQQGLRLDRESHGFNVARIGTPSDDELAEALSIRVSAQSYPDWDLASYRWRFFHKLGPRNILFLARERGTLAGRAIVSIGLKRGAIVGRIVDLVFRDSNCLKALAETIERAFKEIGIPIGFAATSSEEVVQHLKALGWDNRKGFLGTRWVTKRGEERPNDPWIVGGAWDFGCDVRIGD